MILWILHHFYDERQTGLTRMSLNDIFNSFWTNKITLTTITQNIIDFGYLYLVPLERVRLVIKIDIFETKYNRWKLMNIIYISIMSVGFNYHNKDKYKWQGIMWWWNRYQVNTIQQITSNNQETQQNIIIYQTYKILDYM